MTSNGSWQKVRFDEICKNISDRIDDPKQAKTDYYVGLEHLDSEDPKISRHGSPQDVSKTKLLFKPGHILFGKRNWYLRRLAVAQREGICSAHMLVLEPIEGKSTKEFLPLLMFGDDFYEKALMVSAGSMSPTIKWKDLAPLEFLIPSIEQQENILSLTHKIDQTISNSQNLLEKTKNYMISRRELLLTRGIGHTKFKKVKWLYGKTIEIPEEWEVRKISDCNVEITTGSRNTQDKILNGKYPFYVRSQKIERINTFSFDKEAVITAGDGVGTGKVFHYINGKFDLHQRAYSISNFNKKLNGKFFYYYFQKNFFTRAMMMNSIASVDSIRMDTIAGMKILVPPLPEQQQITSILSNINEQITQQQSHLTNLKVLRKSILNSKLTKEKYN